MAHIKFIYLPQSRSANMSRASAGTVLAQKIKIDIIFKIGLILDDLQNNGGCLFSPPKITYEKRQKVCFTTKT
jgi:hypothetical protein